MSDASRKVQELTVSPIIIIGAARSGTKFIRDVLASAEGVRAVPYDVNYVWRTGVQSGAHDALNPDQLTAENIKTIKGNLFKLAGLKQGEVLIEKTVSNSLRVKYVNKVFPNARYVHIIRNGRDTTYSAMRQWVADPDWRSWLEKLRALPLSNYRYVLWLLRNHFDHRLSKTNVPGIWGPRFPGIEEMVQKSELVEVCANQWLQSVICASHDLGQLESVHGLNRVYSVQYEQLVADKQVIENLVEKLELPNGNQIMENYKKMCKPARPGRWSEMSGSDRDLLNQIVQKNAKYFS